MMQRPIAIMAEVKITTLLATPPTIFSYKFLRGREYGVEIMMEAFYPLERGLRVFIDNDGAYPMSAYITWSTRENR